MEKINKSPEKCFAGEYTAALMESNGDEYFMEVDIKEEMVVEVMQELLKEINTCYEVKESPAPSPESFPALMFSTSFGVGGDNERCGPVVSDSASTVMAGVRVGPTKEVAAGEGENIPAGGGEGGGEEEEMDDYDDDDDEWLDRVLSMDPQEFEDLDIGA